VNNWGCIFLLRRVVYVRWIVINVVKMTYISVMFMLRLSVCYQLCARTSKRICIKFSGKVGNGPFNNWLNFGGDPDHRLDTGIVFRIRYYWEIRKVVSTDCAVRRCSARHALAGVAIATMTSLRHRPMTDSGTDVATLVRRALVEVCTVPVLLVLYSTGFEFCRHCSWDIV